jgi:hypothetical protein
MPFPPNRYLGGSGGPISFLLREVITTGYLLAGYKDANIWRNVNRMQHSTDTATDLGDKLTTGGAYCGGMCGTTFAYLTRANSSWLPQTSAVSKFNMVTEIGYGANSTPYSVNQTGQGIQQEKLKAWLVPNGNNALMRFDFASESWLSSVGLSYVGYAGGGNSGFFTETKGWIYEDGNNSMRMTFATETQASASPAGAHDQQHGQSSKLTYVYAGNEGSYNGGYNLRRWNVTTETNSGNITKPCGNTGEENFDMGQDHGYMMGSYDGAQNNRAYRLNYTTDTGFEGSSAMQPKGVGGRSSGIAAWRA